jgi:hypothetical protein
MKETDIIYDIEKYLRHGSVFEYVLKQNHGLFIHKLTAVDYKDYWFEYDDGDIVFLGEPIIDDTTNNHKDFFHVYISDFTFSGKLCYTDKYFNEVKNKITLNATIRVFKQPDCEVNISNVEVWDLNEKLINLSNFSANKKLSGLDLIPYDYGYYTQTWSKIDKTGNDKNQNKQSFVTSYYYLQELIESYERIKHLLSIVLLNDPYSNNYTTIKVKLPKNYNFPYMYEIGDNFNIHDRHYLLYSELTIESYYKFWERVGYYLFQFLNPSSNKVNDKNLSLYKLIKELNNEYSINPYLQNPHFNWFSDFVLKSNSDFDKLINFRHPFVHYKVDEYTGKGVGSLIATVLNNWTMSMFSKEELKQLESENKLIKKFLLEQFINCKTGYEHMIELIKLLPDKK